MQTVHTQITLMQMTGGWRGGMGAGSAAGRAFDGAIMGIWACQDESGTYRMALQVGSGYKRCKLHIHQLLARHAQLFKQETQPRKSIWRSTSPHRLETCRVQLCTCCLVLQLKQGTRLPDDTAAWQAMLQDALPSAPEAR